LSQASTSRRLGRLPRSTLAVGALALLLLAASPAHARTRAVAWTSPTQADKSHLSAKVGSKLAFALAATTSIPDVPVLIQPIGALPSGAMLNSSPRGGVFRATFTWKPVEPGRYTLRFRATTTHGAAAPNLTYVVEVASNVPAVHYPVSQTLTNDRSAQWAPVLRRVAAHKAPNASAPVLTLLGLAAEDGAQNIVLILDELQKSPTETWYRVRLPILPNNSTGWVPASALGELTTVHTHLYVDLAKFRATLMLNGRAIFTTSVGVGEPYWPTPRGEFYIRMKATNFHDPFLGPVGFGTSARSAALTDWPAGGYVGVHGTSLPQLIPGRISHGCVRMRNAAILKLARLMPVGTPLTVR
jgi:L,D-transpeptidase-like protein/putative Ig domain-containing protein